MMFGDNYCNLFYYILNINENLKYDGLFFLCIKIMIFFYLLFFIQCNKIESEGEEVVSLYVFMVIYYIVYVFI